MQTISKVRSTFVMLSRSDLQQVLLRERSRADRTHSQFCLVKLRLPNDDRRAQMWFEYVREQIRVTDYLGREGQEVWCVLVDCSRETAQQLLRQLLGKFSDPDTSTSLFHYPTEPDDLHRAALSSEYWTEEVETAAEQESMAPPAGATVEDHKSEATARPMESLFELSLPWWKRTLDIVLAVVGLCVLSPLMLLVGLLIYCDGRGSVLFVQPRVGRGRRVFSMWKFRTMVPDAEQQKAQLSDANEQDGPAFKMENDPRVTRIGRWLRSTSIDELPQLWNVLRGDMSVVGPRPLPVSESAQCESWQRHREDATPGLTCFWQVRERRSKIPFAEWVRLDLRYIKSHSLSTDITLIIQTILKVLCRRSLPAEKTPMGRH